jgi:hypothetical protein
MLNAQQAERSILMEKLKKFFSKPLHIIAAVLIFVVLIVAINIIQCQDYDGVYVGMSSIDYRELKPHPDNFFYRDYGFFKNASGHHVVVHFSRDSAGKIGKVDEIKVFNKWFINNSPRNFESIKKGDSIYSVIAKVGIPIGTTTSGASSCDFVSSKGKGYLIYWHDIHPVQYNTEFVVDNVISVEELEALHNDN